MSALRLPAVAAAALLSLAASIAGAQTNPPDVVKEVIAPTGPLPNARATVSPVRQADLLKPAGDEWLTYHGDYSGRHFSGLRQIDRRTIGTLQRVWTSEVNPPVTPAGRRLPPAFAAAAPAPSGSGRTGSGGGFGGNGGVRSIPLFHDGALFFTNGQNAYAIDARTGRQIWHYIANTSGGISNRGLAIAGDSLFMMANGGLTALDVATGVERWRTNIGGPVPANAPVVIRDHVFVVSGSDGGSGRAWLESRNAKTGEREWIWYVSPQPGAPGAETWPSANALAMGAGTPWQPLTYDPDLDLLFVGTGNPYPMKDGRTRVGDNLYTSSVVALNPDTGKLVWHFQMTPHDEHDYDGNQVTMLFDKTIGGRTRKLLGVVGRGGFLFVLDRTTGENLLTSRLFDEINWTRFNRPNGTPEPDPHKAPQAGGALVFPGSEGITNYPAPAYDPQTGLIYSNLVKSWSMFYYGANEYFIGDFRNSLRALDPATGKTVWSHEYLEPYGIHARYPGVLATAGGVVFTGDVSGNVVGFDARNGKILWHDELPTTSVTNAPMTYMLDDTQYIVVGSGSALFAYALPTAAR